MRKQRGGPHSWLKPSTKTALCLYRTSISKLQQRRPLTEAECCTAWDIEFFSNIRTVCALLPSFSVDTGIWEETSPILSDLDSTWILKWVQNKLLFHKWLFLGKFTSFDRNQESLRKIRLKWHDLHSGLFIIQTYSCDLNGLSSIA